MYSRKERKMEGVTTTGRNERGGIVGREGMGRSLNREQGRKGDTKKGRGRENWRKRRGTKRRKTVVGGGVFRGGGERSRGLSCEGNPSHAAGVTLCVSPASGVVSWLTPPPIPHHPSLPPPLPHTRFPTKHTSLCYDKSLPFFVSSRVALAALNTQWDDDDKEDKYTARSN